MILKDKRYKRHNIKRQKIKDMILKTKDKRHNIKRQKIKDMILKTKDINSLSF